MYCLKNGILIPISYKHHTLQQITHSSVIDILCQSIRELFTSECHNLGRNTYSNYMQKHTFQDCYIKDILLSFFLTETYLSRPLYKIYITFFLSELFSCPIIRVSRQCLDVYRLYMSRQCLVMFTQCLDVSKQCQYVSRHVQMCLHI